MNTATRVIVAQNVRTRNRTFQITKQVVVIVALVIALLCSAFGVVYFKDLNRRLFIQYQTLQREKAEELIQWGKLLLEQTTWSTQSRVQRIAEQQLGMQLPSAKEVILVNADAMIE
ncbi:cell division protein FtsL [Coxiella burnetii]|uniref:cell division protein FtsL n=1 Tax=Coxiella burnetii TaxID=777 RepID=UPI002175F9EC|nr:cell division protein FtsL [Coxiella burnetii]